MSLSHYRCHDHDLSADEGNRNSDRSVCQPVTFGDEGQSQMPLNHQPSPISCYESVSIKTDDYIFPFTPVTPITIPRHTGGLVTVQNLVFDPITLRRELALMVILHEYPLSIIHHVGFRSFVTSINPSFRIVSQETVWNDIMSIRNIERSIAIGELGSSTSRRVAITTKMWASSDGNRNFLAIVGHMIQADSQWERRSYMIRFASVPVRCTNESVAKVLLASLSEFEVDDRLTTITFDDHTSDNELTDILQNKLSKSKFLLGGKLFRIPCFAHTLSLMVQDAFDVVNDTIEKIRDSILFWIESQEREEKFKKAARDSGLSTKIALVLDYDSKWDSTFLMMQQSILLKDVFIHLKNQESQHSSLPTEDEWAMVSEVCQRLEVLYEVMNVLKTEPPSCSYFIYIAHIKVSLSYWRNSEIREIKEMASRMSEKFDKYWLATRYFLGVAAVFHPSYRYFDGKLCLSKIYGDEAESESEKIRELFDELYDEYYKSFMALKRVKDDEKQIPGRSRNLYMRWLREQKRKSPELSELDYYIQGSEDVDSDEIISWWNKNSKYSYPILREIAKDILAIPICSVDPENVFDLGDRVLSPTRSRLKPAMVETLMCTQSWVSNQKRLEKRSTLKSKHSLGTIYDDANAEQGIFYKYKVKSAETGDTSDSTVIREKCLRVQDD